MKKVMSFIICIVVLFSISISVGADTQGAVTPSGAIVVKVDGNVITFPDAKPYINEDNRTLVPVRFVSEALNSKVQWEATTQTVIIYNDTTRVVLQIGQDYAIVNNNTSDTKIAFDTAAVIKDGRTFVPLRFMSQTLGACVQWFSDTSTAVIDNEYATYLEPADLIRKVCDYELDGNFNAAFAYFSDYSKQKFNYANYIPYSRGFIASAGFQYSIDLAHKLHGATRDDAEIKCKVTMQSEDTCRVVFGLFGKGSINNANIYNCRTLSRISGKWYLNFDDEHVLYSDYFKDKEGI